MNISALLKFRYEVIKIQLQTITDTVLQSLRESGAKERTIARNYECFYRGLLNEVDGNQELDESIVSFYLIGKYGRDLLFLPNNQLKRHEQSCKHAFNVLLAFQTNGLPPQYQGIKSHSENDLEILQNYLSFCSEAGNNPCTIQRKQDSIKRFLSTTALQDITESEVERYMQSFIGKSSYYQKRELDEAKKFLSYCTAYGYISKDYLSTFPDIKAVKDSRIPSVFTDDEIKGLLSYFSEKHSKNKRRDYAMALLMAVYGLRSIDIVSLHCTYIDFEKGALTFSQSKTGTVIRHRLLPHIGNTLVDYILNERPKSNTTLLFLKQDGMGLLPKSVSSVIRNGFLSSGVYIGERKYGSHSLRHSLASSLINQGTSIFTVASVLGQTSAETARLYAKVDLAKLSLCALEVPTHG